MYKYNLLEKQPSQKQRDLLVFLPLSPLFQIYILPLKIQRAEIQFSINVLSLGVIF